MTPALPRLTRRPRRLQPRADAEEAIRQARVPDGSRALVPVEPAGIEPATSCLQSESAEDLEQPENTGDCGDDAA
jgi:hypothetical protein